MKDYILNNNPNDCYDRGCDVWPEVFDCQEKQKRKSQQQPKRSESTEPEVKRKITNNKTNADIWNSIMDHTKKQTKQLIHDKTWDDDDEEEEKKMMMIPKPKMKRLINTRILLQFLTMESKTRIKR